MQALAGINKDNRAKLSLLIRAGRGMVTVSEAARILGVVPKRASVILSQFANNGWLSRIKRGVYVVLPMEAQSNDAVIEDAWDEGDHHGDNGGADNDRKDGFGGAIVLLQNTDHAWLTTLPSSASRGESAFARVFAQV